MKALGHLFAWIFHGHASKPSIDWQKREALRERYRRDKAWRRSTRESWADLHHATNDMLRAELGR